MSNKVKKKLQDTFKSIEKNFQTLANNKDIKKVLKEMSKLRDKRSKQIESMLNQPLEELKKSYKKEVKAMEDFFKDEIKKTKKVFNEQLKELEKMKKTVEGHIKTATGKVTKSAPIKKKKTTTKKKTVKKKTAKKKTTKKKSKR